MPIYIIRHAECESNTKDLFVGAFESPLTQRGLEQIEHLGSHLCFMDFDCIYTSPLQRAKQTACVLKGPIVISPKLLEMNGGDWEGKTITDLQKEESYLKFFADLDNGFAPNGESTQDMRERVALIKDFLLYEPPTANIAVVAHGIILMVLLSELLNKPINELPMLCNASITILNLVDGKPKVRLWNSDGYIPRSLRQVSLRKRTGDPSFTE